MKRSTLVINLISIVIINMNVFSQSDIFNENRYLMNTDIIDSAIVLTAHVELAKFIYLSDNNSNIKYLIKKTFPYNEWINKEKITYTYDENDFLKSEKYENWVNDDWATKRKVNFAYNSLEKLQTEITEFWNSSTDTLRADSKQIRFYDVNGILKSKIFQVYNDTGWTNRTQFSYEYDNDGNLLFDNTSRWNGLEFEKYFVHEFTYDSLGNRISWIQKQLFTNDWENISLVQYAYNNNAKVSEISKDWNKGAWKNSQRTTYDYNQNGLVKTEYIENWINNSSWNNMAKRTFNYDENNKLIEKHIESWQNSSWQDNFRYYYSFDYKQRMISGKFEMFQNGSWGPYNDSFGIFDQFGTNRFTGAELQIFYKTLTDYQEDRNSILNYKLSQNYPNPFNPTTTIKYSIPKNSYISIKLFNVLGKEVMNLDEGEKMKGSYEIELNAVGLASGVYYYQLKSGNYIQTKKLLLLK